MKSHLWRKLLIVVAVLVLFFLILVVTAPGGRPISSSASVKANLANIRVQAQIVHNATSPASYETVCTDAQIQKMLAGAKKGAISVKCFSDIDTFVSAAAFKKPSENNTHYCVDSSGVSKVITAEKYSKITTADTLCS